MGILTRAVTILFAAGGLSVFSQAPEFAQQYRQRLGGAVGELRTVVEDFDKDAANSNLTRRQALQQMVDSGTQLFHDRGVSMGRTVDRFEALIQQQSLMERAHPVTRPLFVLQTPDRKVLEGAWAQFEPAVPLNVPGLVYGGFGALLLALMARAGIGSARALARGRKMAKGVDKASGKEEIAPAGRAAGPLPPAALAPGTGPVPQRYPPGPAGQAGTAGPLADGDFGLEQATAAGVRPADGRR